MADLTPFRVSGPNNNAKQVSTTYQNDLLTELGGGLPTVNAKAYGATGTGDETLSSTSYQTERAAVPVTITQQTVDGLAINEAIVALRALGGGTLYIPEGEYTTYGYLERIDFPCQIVGSGPGVTTLRNITASPWDNGYGILFVEPSTLSEVTISDLTLDGYATNRTLAGEKRAYPLTLNGLPKATLTNVEAINSPIDCLYTGYTNGANGCSVQATNCFFSNSYRNTCSLVSGWNQQYTNCIFEKGGMVQGGTSPRYVLDIEPDAAANTIKNITFDNCIFREAESVIVGGIWAGNVKFNGCTMDAFGSATAGQPWLTNFRGGEFTLNNCTLQHTHGDYNGQARFTNPVGTGDFATTEFVELNNCTIKGAGIQGYGRKMIFNNVTVKETIQPVSFTGNGIQNLHIDGLRLINVLHTTASFTIAADFEGYGNISNVEALIEPDSITGAFLTAASGNATGRGILISATATPTLKVSNVHAAGYYQKLPTALSKALNTTNFRDWQTPSAPPADTAGQTAGPSAIYYRNCTEYGNSP